LSIIDELEDTPELEDELALFNKVGDLYVKVGNVASAVEMYERAVNKYSEGGFYNNAIALCNKVLRNAPGRTHVYLKLAQLMVQRGFVAEAKQNLLEYADRMKSAGKLDEAFRALKEFADLSPNNEEIRLVLAEQLKAAARTEEAREQLAKLYHEAQASGDARRSRATIEKMKAIDPEYDVETAPKPKAKPRPEKSTDLVFLDLGDDIPSAPAPPPPRAAAKPAPPRKPPVEEPPAPAPVPAPAPEPLMFEPTSLAEPAAAPEEVVEEALPVERASMEFDASGVDAGTMEGLTGTGMEAPADVTPVSDFEPTMLGQATGADEVAEQESEAPAPEEPAGAGLPLIIPEETEFEPLRSRAGRGDMPSLDVEVEPPALEPPLMGGESGLEVPELDLGGMEEPRPELVPPEGGLDLEIELPPLEEIAGPPDVGALASAVAEDPDDPVRHQRLGEALIETGQREPGLQELDIALTTYEARDDWHHAEDMAEEILRLDPNSVRHHQKRVEYAFRRGEQAHLVDAYLALSDALFRSGAMERARAVYQRVLELDATNERARTALATLEPAPAVPAGKPAKPAPATGDFVDLGALVLDEEARPKDARMRIEDEEPTGDEQRDFDEMLAQFKKGIEASLGIEDVQAHYDLGVAFKEMGLLDEAISEFQKALRGPEGRLRTSEALGTCFFEKGQYSVAATVLRRAVESDPGGDEDKIGLLYWIGRCEEELDRKAEALSFYQRVFAVDIGFQDVRDRVKQLAKARR
jgi:tetratricopeptide (TPR) repeat protein